MSEQNQFDCLDDRVKNIIQLLSTLTAQPVTKWEMKPERFNGKLLNEIPFEADLHLGEEYRIHLWHNLKRGEGFARDNSEWAAHDCGFEVYHKEDGLLGKRVYGSSEVYSREQIKDDLNIINRTNIDFLIRRFGGINVEQPAFMDYERYSVESLNGEQDYFMSPYLLIMCHLKGRGIEMPPILSMDAEIRQAMFDGDIKGVNSLLDEKLSVIVADYEKPSLVHAQAEAEKIRRFTEQRLGYHDQSIPLIEKFPNFDVVTIPGSNGDKKYNILVVEQFGVDPFVDAQGTVRRLSRKLAIELARKGKYCGTNIFRSMNLPACMDICATGQIDAIIMDPGHNPKAIAQQIIESAGGRAELFQNGVQMDIPQTSGYQEKEKWRDKIYKGVRKNGHEPPPCFIGRENILENDLGSIVDSMLNARHPLAEIQEKLKDKHHKEMMDAYDLEQKASGAVLDAVYDEEYSPEIREQIEALIFEQDMRHAKPISKIGTALTKEEFYTAFYCFVRQQIPDDIEKTTPSEIMKGLQAVEIVLARYPEFGKDDLTRDNLSMQIGSQLELATRQAGDISYYTRNDGRMRLFVDLVANVYTYVDNLQKQEYLKGVAENVKELGTLSMDSHPCGINRFVNRVVKYTLCMASETYDRGSSIRKNPLIRFLIIYARKLAKMADGIDEFNFYYKKYFVGEESRPKLPG